MRKSTKVIVLGFDGLSTKYTDSLINKSVLTSMSKVKASGVSGTLVSTIPPISAPAWSSIVTGLTPGNHGVFNFLTLDSSNPNKKVRINDSSRLRGIAIWDLLGRKGKKSVVVNVPLTFPSYDINGIMVAGFPSPINKLDATPKSLERFLRDKYPHYKIDLDIPQSEYDKVEKSWFVEESFELLDEKISLVKELFMDNEWDLFFPVFTISDRLQHVFWSDFDVEGGESHPTLESLYLRLDEVVGFFLDEMDDDTVLFIISDHGFESVSKKFNVREWLCVNGYIARNNEKNPFNFLKRIYKIVSSLKLFDLTSLFNKLPDRVKNMFLSENVVSLPGGIYYNHYIFSGEIEPNKMRDELVKVTFPETREPVIHSIYLKEELYRGKFVDDAVDMIIVPNTGFLISSKPDEPVFSEISPAISTHVSDDVRRGIFFVHGKNVVTGSKSINCFDLAPIVYFLLTGETWSGFDGKVRSDLFTK